MRSPVNSSALHVLQTLRLVCASEFPLSNAEISRRTSLPPTTVFRALSTLEDAQYAQRAQGSMGYEAGIVPQLLLWTLLKRFPLATFCVPYLTRLAELSGGTASLCVRLGWYGLRVCVIYGSNDIYHRDRLGEVALLHSSLATRGIFAFLSDDEIEEYRRFAQRHHESEARDIDRLPLRREVQAGREVGYCIAEAAAPDEAPSFAMPLRDGHGRVVAAIALSGSANDATPGKAAVLPEEWRSVWSDFDAALAQSPALAASHYAHIEPGEIVIRLTERTPAT
jgi:DNA-binding IclR family transcriptional regulator